MMITIQKLPSLEPEMRGALRSHIMRKRQRLKQAEEQDAIEKRMKKEREQKRIQDAMTLDQIKEQLSTLEKRLQTLQSEKHNLFVQLKQVMNEGISKRKQASESNTANSDSSHSDGQTKRPKIDDEGEQSSKTPSAPDRPLQGQPPAATPTTAITTATSSATATPLTGATPITKLSANSNVVGKPIETITSRTIPMSHETRISDLNIAQKSSASHPRHNSQPSQMHLADKFKNLNQLSASGFNPSTSMQINSAPNSQHSNDLRFGLPPLPLSHAHSPFINNQNLHPEMINFSRHDPTIPPPSSTNTMSPQQLAALHFKSPFANAHLQSQIPPELLMASRLDPALVQRFGLHNRLPPTSMPPDVSMSLAQQAETSRMLNSFSNLPKSNYPGPLDINGARWDERTLMSLKKGPNGVGSPFHTNQLLGVDGSFPPSLAHLNFLNHAAIAGNIDPSTSIGQSMLSSLSQSNPQSPINFNPRKISPQNIPRSGVEFMLGNIRPGGMLIPNLGPIYSSQQSGTPPTSMFAANGPIDLEHLNALYHPSQHMAGSMAHFNNTLAKQQQQHFDQQQHLHNLHQQQQHQQQQQQQEQASRLFAASNSTSNYHRKPAPKHPYR